MSVRTVCDGRRDTALDNAFCGLVPQFAVSTDHKSGQVLLRHACAGHMPSVVVDLMDAPGRTSPVTVERLAP